MSEAAGTDAALPVGQEEFERLDNVLEMQDLLEAMREPGTVVLVWPDGKTSPVTLLETLREIALDLDISLLGAQQDSLAVGSKLRLRGQVRGKLINFPTLEVLHWTETQEGWQCRCAWPPFLEVLLRRDTFRAVIRLNMHAGVLVEPLLQQSQGGQLQADLRDLSLDGCRLELPRDVLALLTSPPPFTLTFCFPNGQRFVIDAEVRHAQEDAERHLVTVGFHFPRRTAEQDRQLWYYVREIEREGARHLARDTTRGAARLASPLFRAKPGIEPVGRRQGNAYPTPMAHRLAPLAEYLDTQWLALQQGEPLSLDTLSQQADQLLELLNDDREALLFALVCMRDESPQVQHALTVSVRLLELAAGARMPLQLRKAMAAAALVHDLGKALLAPELLHATAANDDQYRQMQRHVPLLIAQLDACPWLPRAVISDVVEGSNERLDGSGYPRGLAGDQLHQLARMAMIVDVVDTLGRARPDRPAWTIGAIYRYLLAHPEQFDAYWVKRYILHFGRLPVGTLVRFSGGELGWVLRRDRHGNPSQVQLTPEAVRPGSQLGPLVHDATLLALGEPVAALPLPE